MRANYQSVSVNGRRNLAGGHGKWGEHMKLNLWALDSAEQKGLKKLAVMVVQYLLELIVLSVFFLISCLPVATIPFALYALGSVLMDFCRARGSRPLRSYWKRFFAFRKRTFFTLAPLAALELCLTWGLLVYLAAETELVLFWLACGVNAVTLLVLFAMSFYLIPLLIETEEGPLRLWKQAAILVFLRLPYTVAALCAIVLLWGLCIRHFQSAWIVMVLLAPALSGLIGTFCGDAGLRAYLPSEKGES